ncbi:MAG: acetate kinase [Proteobacteria bacterium]|nr:acetate kinase [Pseudomonadota bacterium]
MPYILALNCGSSTLKYQVFDAETKQSIVGGNAEKIGLPGAFITQKYPDGTKTRKDTEIQDHNEALRLVIFMLGEASIDLADIAGVGHRVVHGGEKFAATVKITDEVIKTIEELSDLAPLHNPANLIGIRAARAALPHAVQVAIFDTAFHQTMPDYSYRYAVPASWYTDLGIRKYGFHGTSHLYVSKRAAAILGKPASNTNLISIHYGSGASVCAIENGISITTSMGMTPLSGLIMGTRCGDISPSVYQYAKEKLGMTDAQTMDVLNKKSGVLGITGKYSDQRDLEAHQFDDDSCRLALDMEAWRVKKYIGQYMATINGPVDAIIFTAGTGENDAPLRMRICKNLDHLGIKLDAEKNAATAARTGSGETEISAPDSKIKVFMIPTNEELVLVEDTIAVINGTYNPDHLKMNYLFA